MVTYPDAQSAEFSAGVLNIREGAPASQFTGMWERGRITVGDTFVETSNEHATWGFELLALSHSFVHVFGMCGYT